MLGSNVWVVVVKRGVNHPCLFLSGFHSVSAGFGWLAVSGLSSEKRLIPDPDCISNWRNHGMFAPDAIFSHSIS